MTLLGSMKSHDIDRKILQKAVQSVSVLTCMLSECYLCYFLLQVVMSPNLPSSLPHLNLLGRLLHSHSQLISDVLHSFGE